MDRENIVLAMPRSGSMLTDGAGRAFYLWPTQKHRVAHLEASHSAATHTFNNLWAESLNMREKGFRYFCMLHSDVAPEQWWLDVLLDEMHRVQADVLSAVIPIKSDEGITSTALDKGDLWCVCRLTMKEVMELPETFDSKDVGYPLLLNNGLWICDITKPWAEGFSFEMLNRIGKTRDGRFFTQMIPEDWLCSRKFHELGLKIYATRKVKLYHDQERYTNQTGWGEWSRDEAWYRIHEARTKSKEEALCV